MIWILWRQYKKTLLFTTIAFGAYIVALAVTGQQNAELYRHHQNIHGLGYASISRGVMSLAYASLAIPLLLGMFWGIPLFAKEYEDGTHKLAWAQSVTRRKWLIAKLLWLLSAGAVYGALAAIALTIWGHTGHALSADNRFQPYIFTMQYLVPLAVTLFAISLGAAVGAWLRRLLPAFAVSMALFSAIWCSIVFYARPHYQTPVTHRDSYSLQTTTGSGGSFDLSNPNAYYPPLGSWVLQPGLPGISCNPPVTNSTPIHTSITCTSYTTYTFQPANRFWRFQIIESMIYLGLAISAVIATAWAVLKRSA